MLGEAGVENDLFHCAPTYVYIRKQSDRGFRVERAMNKRKEEECLGDKAALDIRVYDSWGNRRDQYVLLFYLAEVQNPIEQR